MRRPRERPERERPEPVLAQAAGLDAPALNRPEPRVLAAFAAALVAGVLAWVALSYHGWTRHAAAPATTAQASGEAVGPTGLDVDGLRVQAAKLGQPVYWLGPEGGVTYELKRLAGGSVFLRYLPRGVAVGTQGPYRTVGTYPYPGAFAAVHGLAQETDTVWFKVRDGGIAVFRRSSPTNVYLAWPGFDYEIEVYDPEPAQARRLAASSALRRMSGT